VNTSDADADLITTCN